MVPAAGADDRLRRSRQNGAIGGKTLIADGSEAAAGPGTRDAEDEREWIPREITDAPPYVYARARSYGEGAGRRREARDRPPPAPFDRSRSRLRDALGGPSGNEQAGGALELRLRLAKERGSELERRIRDAEERVARVLGQVDRNELEVRKLFSREARKPK